MQEFYNFSLGALLVINLGAFVAVGWDKKKSLQGRERSPEVIFFLWAVLFGSLGVFLGIFIFRHKTRKIYFPLGIGLLLIQQMVLFMLLSNAYL